jgi:hypothetical protein
MAHTYILFDFGADEEKAQRARHKLEGWKQAFRLDKKLQFKFDRSESASREVAAGTEKPEKPEKPEKSSKSGKPKAKSKPKADGESSEAAASNGSVKLLVRLYFSPHEKLSEQRWLQRIPAEEPFNRAAPRVVQEGESGFPEALAQFDGLD